MSKTSQRLLLPIKKHCIEKPSASGTQYYSVPSNSLDFESTSSQALSIAGSTFGALNGTKWTYHVWYKRESTGALMAICRKDPAGSPEPVLLRFTAGNTIDALIRDGAGTLIARKVTTATFTDTASWHQMVLYWDSNNATSTDRLRLYHDQAKITAFGTDTTPSLGASVGDTADGNVYMGYTGTTNYFDGKLFQQAWFNGTNPDISTLHNGGSPVPFDTNNGLISYMEVAAGDAVGYDNALRANWTNINSVVKSVDVPV